MPPRSTAKSPLCLDLTLANQIVSGLDQLERPTIGTADAQVSSWHTCRTADSGLAGAALPPGGDPVDTRPHLGAQARGK
jgi:hypothetical protein